MTPELAPVRGPKRPGVDRGVVVAVVAAALIGLLAAKPWGAKPLASAVPSAHASPPPLAIHSSPAPPGATTEEMLSLTDVTAALGSVPRAGGAALVMSFWRPEPLAIAYLRMPPRTRDLGTDCAGGALLGEGTDAIGVSLPAPSRPMQAVRFRLIRLFATQPAVPVPVETEVDHLRGVALIRPDGIELSVGHYALTMDTIGRSGIVTGSDTVPLCVGHMTRLVDYSLVTFVPEGVHSAAARTDLLQALAAR